MVQEFLTLIHTVSFNLNLIQINHIPVTIHTTRPAYGTGEHSLGLCVRGVCVCAWCVYGCDSFCPSLAKSVSQSVSIFVFA